MKLGSPNKTKLIAVIAFPFGFIPNSHKQAEAEWAEEKVAEELDVVPNFFYLSQLNLTSELKILILLLYNLWLKWIISL